MPLLPIYQLLLRCAFGRDKRNSPYVQRYLICHERDFQFKVNIYQFLRLTDHFSEHTVVSN